MPYFDSWRHPCTSIVSINEPSQNLFSSSDERRISMASVNNLLLVFFLVLLFLQMNEGVESNSDRESGSIETREEMHTAHKTQKIDCKSACKGRCSKAGNNKRCTRACRVCCQRCNCVPPGTFGHREVCPCYANMRTHGNKLKCP